jgi:hypothetical protein
MGPVGDQTHASAEDRARARETRRGELMKLTKPQLAERYRRNGYLGSAHPLSAWTKPEIVSSLLSLEFPEPTT